MSISTQRSVQATIFIGSAAVITWAALVLQFVLFLETGPELGLGITATVAKFFTFMTNLVGLATACVFTASLWKPGRGALRFFSRPDVQGAVLVYALLVFLVYHFMLANTWEPEPAWWLAAVLLHYVVPGCYLVFWVLLIPRGTLRWVHVAEWQLFPVAYAVVIMAVGDSLAGYPYPFLDVGRAGWSSALLAMLNVLAGYVGLSVAVVAIDRWRSSGDGPLTSRKAGA